MTEPLTITQLDQTATEWIEQEAQRTGMPIEAVARQLIYRGLTRAAPG
jgi:DNA polymerase III delta subunit